MFQSPCFAQGWSCGKDIQGRGIHPQGAVQQKDKDLHNHIRTSQGLLKLCPLEVVKGKFQPN